MQVALYVEGPSDKALFRKIMAVLGHDGVPVRAGHGSWRGDALWRSVVQIAPEEKVVFLFDRNKSRQVDAVLQRETAVPARTIAMLCGVWEGAEDLIEGLLNPTDRLEYQRRRAGRLSKRLLAEAFVDRIDADRVRSHGWLNETLRSCLECRCPEGSVLSPA